MATFRGIIGTLATNNFIRGKQFEQLCKLILLTLLEVIFAVVYSEARGWGYESHKTESYVVI